MARNEKTPTKVVRVRKLVRKLAWYVSILFFYYFFLFLFFGRKQSNFTYPASLQQLVGPLLLPFHDEASSSNATDSVANFLTWDLGTTIF